MAGTTPTGVTTIDLQRDNQSDTERQVDASAYVAAKIFGEVALPADIPAIKAEFIEAAANSAQRLDVNGLTIGGAFGGPIGDQTRAQRERKVNDEYVEYLVVQTETAERREREQREREEWSHTKSTVAGVTLTGAEWTQLADRLRNDEDLRQRVIDAFKKRGMSDTEAEARVERVAEVAEIAAIPPSQRTDDQKRTFDNALSDPSIKNDLQQASSITAANSVPNSTTHLRREFSSAASGAASPELSSAPASPPPAPSAILNGPGF